MRTRWIEPDLGLCVIEGALSPRACRRLIAESEAEGYAPAPITTARGFVMMPEVRDNTRVHRVRHRVRHRGAPVTAGRKYVMRTDVMYRRA